MNIQELVKSSYFGGSPDRANRIVIESIDGCDLSERDPEPHEVTFLRSLWSIRLVFFGFLTAFRIDFNIAESPIEDLIALVREKMFGEQSDEFWRSTEEIFWAQFCFCSYALRPSREEILKVVHRRLPLVERELLKASQKTIRESDAHAVMAEIQRRIRTRGQRR